MKYIVMAFVAYLIFRFVFNFLIPVYKTTRHIRKNFRDMHSKVQEQQQGAGNFSNDPRPSPSDRKNEDDYIEFEEVK